LNVVPKGMFVSALKLIQYYFDYKKVQFWKNWPHFSNNKKLIFVFHKVVKVFRFSELSKIDEVIDPFPTVRYEIILTQTYQTFS